MAFNFHDESIFHADDPLLENAGFKNKIGVFIFLARQIRPDNTTSVGILSQFVVNPTKFVFNAAKGVSGYFKETAQYVLQFSLTKIVQNI